jgi:hypothetical protein
MKDLDLISRNYKNYLLGYFKGGSKSKQIGIYQVAQHL